MFSLSLLAASLPLAMGIIQTDHYYITTEMDGASETYLNWAAGEDYCKSKYGTHLATICNDLENDELRSTVRGGSKYIGLQADGSWTSGAGCSTYRRWLAGSPNWSGLANSHVVVSIDGWWYSVDGNVPYYVACDRYAGHTIPTDNSGEKSTAPVGLGYTSYPDCLPNCAKDNAGLVLKINGNCYFAKTNCRGCLTSPQEFPCAFQPVICPSNVATDIDYIETNENVESDVPRVSDSSNSFEIYAIIAVCVGLLLIGLLMAQKKKIIMCRKGYNQITNDKTHINSKQTQEYQA